jgi:hypothetical protein
MNKAPPKPEVFYFGNSHIRPPEAVEAANVYLALLEPTPNSQMVTDVGYKSASREYVYDSRKPLLPEDGDL